MLAIRLSRTGKKNTAYFRVVVMDKRKSAKGRALEVVGAVNPHNKKETKLNSERILYWLSMGAQASGRVHNLLVDKKVIDAPKRKMKIKIKKKEGDETAEAPSLASNANGGEQPVQQSTEIKESTVEEIKEEKTVEEEIKEEIPVEEVKVEEVKLEEVAGETKEKEQKEETKAKQKEKQEEK